MTTHFRKAATFMLQALRDLLYTPSLLHIPLYTPSLVGFCATSGILFLWMLVLRWVLPPLRRVIPAASRVTVTCTLLASISCSVGLLGWGRSVERWDFDVLWATGELLVLFAWMHLTVHLLSRSRKGNRHA